MKTKLTTPWAASHPVAAITIVISATHGVVAGLILGTYGALVSDGTRSRLAEFGLGFATGTSLIALVTFVYFFHHRKEFPR